MPRRREVPKRKILPDPKYGDRLVSKFVNSLMFQGRKSTAEGILYGALDLLEERTKGQDPVEIFKNAVENIRPAVEVKSRRVGGSTYQVPVEVRPDRRTALAIRWLITASRARGERTMRERLANELLELSDEGIDEGLNVGAEGRRGHGDQDSRGSRSRPRGARRDGREASLSPRSGALWHRNPRRARFHRQWRRGRRMRGPLIPLASFEWVAKSDTQW